MSTTIDTSLERYCVLALRLSLGLFACSLGLLGLFGWRLPAFIPLFFSRPFGAQQLAPFWVLFFYPVFLFVFYFSAWWVYKKSNANLITQTVYLWVTFLASLFLSLSLFYVLMLVF